MEDTHGRRVQGGPMDTSSVPSGAVVVAFDGSQHADRALEWGAAVAVREHRPLVLVHATDLPNPSWAAFPAIPQSTDLQALRESVQDAGERLLGDAAERVRRVHPSADVHTHCEAGDPRELLVSLSSRAHLLTIGSRGRGMFRRLLLGSVATAVTRHAECPVVVLRPHSEVSSGAGVLVGVDGTTPQARETLHFAFRAASWTDSALTVLYCFWDLSREDPGDALVADDDREYTAERALISESMAGLREKYPDVDVRVQLARGLVDRVLLDLTPGRDLLVVGARSHGAVGEALLGSVATTMLEQAPCPVAVVPSQRP